MLPPLAPARQAGKHAVVTRVRNWRKMEGMLPRPLPARSVFETVPARLSGSSSKMAAPDGFAPSSADSESAVLLLDDRAVKVVNPEVVATSPMSD